MVLRPLSVPCRGVYSHQPHFIHSVIKYCYSVTRFITCEHKTLPVNTDKGLLAAAEPATSLINKRTSITHKQEAKPYTGELLLQANADL